MNLDALNRLTPELKALLMSVLNTGPQELPQNKYPAVASEVFSRNIRQRTDHRGVAIPGDVYAADGKLIPNNPRDNAAGYKHAPYPKVLHKISDFEYETVFVDPKTTEEKLVSKRVRTKDAGAELVAAGWTPKIICKIVANPTELAAEKKRGWLETPESFKQAVEAFPEE